MSNLFFRQMEVGHHAVFAYLIGDLRSHEAMVVDPADDVDELIALASRNRLKIKEIINTHGHVDHIMGKNWGPYQNTRVGGRISGKNRGMLVADVQCPKISAGR
jgi:glyoxylase-like metal-dependent hydrolase (beta-lactamase superfamily II)